MTPLHLPDTHTVRVPGKLVLLLAALLVTGSTGAAGQDASDAVPQSPQESVPYAADEVPAHLAIVDGAAVLERDGRSEEAVENLPLLAGDRLRTQRGRVDIQFADGSTVDLDEHTDVDLLSDSLMRLHAGRVRVSLSRAALNASGEMAEYRVDSLAGSVLIRAAGDYRMALVASRGEPAIDLAVWRGMAELQNAFGRTLVRPGMHAYAVARSAPSLPFGFNSALWDDFDRWTEDLRGARYGASSAAYLPADLRYYSGRLDRYGSWDYEPEYGRVWYPRVDVGWRPYYAGRWSFVGRFGWFWVGVDRWSWPTHHYGRWGLSRANRWFWVPGRRWAPAWVSWGYAPGYVTWCPLGLNGYPVVSVTSVHYSRGWSILPSRLFTHNVFVSRHLVDARYVSSSVRSAIAVRSAAPAWQHTGRASSPLRGPGAGRFNASRLDESPVQRMRPDGGATTGRAVPRNAPLSQAPGARPADANRPLGSAPAQMYRRGLDAQPGSLRPSDDRLDRSRAQPRAWQAPRPGSPSRQVEPAPRPLGSPRQAIRPRARTAPERSAPVPRYAPPQRYSSPQQYSAPERYSRPMPLQRPMPGEGIRAMPRAQPRSDMPRFSRPAQGMPSPGVGAPSRPRPADSGGAGRAVERRGGRRE